MLKAKSQQTRQHVPEHYDQHEPFDHLYQVVCPGRPQLAGTSNVRLACTGKHNRQAPKDDDYHAPEDHDYHAPEDHD